MVNIHTLRQTEAKILMIGNHPGIIQSILDFDYLSGKKQPSIKLIVAGNRKFARYFFGKKEILIPVAPTLEKVPQSVKESTTYFLNVTSGRRVLTSSAEALTNLPSLLGGAVFAENVPEEHALALYHLAEEQKKFIIGPASVGLLLPGILKLGAIGGVDAAQLVTSDVMTPGDTAVFSASGGMTNEIIRIVAQADKHLSFALSFGGERFPVITPEAAFLAAQSDPETKQIIYFGELGGTDEYKLVELLKNNHITKPVVCYIGGVVAELFEEPPQFGHAKALAQTSEETARAKRDALREAGAKSAESFAEFVQLIHELPTHGEEKKSYTSAMDDLAQRKHALIATSISYDEDGEVKLLGEDLLSFTSKRSFAAIVGCLFLGKQTISSEVEKFIDFVLRLLVDHGPYVSGAVNTIITARAGRDLESALATGLLTIGPRFGGAINQAAVNWLKGVSNEVAAPDFVEEFAARKEYIPGIGHRKYRVDLPDPRVQHLLQFSDTLSQKRFTTFAKAVEKVTVAKKGNLILNVDGTIAAVLLDLLSEKEGMSDEELQALTTTEFFNALFVLSRSVGFIAHFLDQKRLDEGLFRLSEDMVTTVEEQ